MSKIRTPFAYGLARGLARRLALAIVLAGSAPAFAEARIQPLVARTAKLPIGTAALVRSGIRPAAQSEIALNIIVGCTRTGPRMVC